MSTGKTVEQNIPTPWDMIRALANKKVEKKVTEGRIEYVMDLTADEYANLLRCEVVVKTRNADLEDLLERENKRYQITRGG